MNRPGKFAAIKRVAIGTNRNAPGASFFCGHFGSWVAAAGETRRVLWFELSALVTEHEKRVNSVSFGSFCPVLWWVQLPSREPCFVLFPQAACGQTQTVIPCFCLQQWEPACDPAGIARLHFLLREVRALERRRQRAATIGVSGTQKGTRARAILPDSVF